MREYFPVIKKSALFQGISEDDLDGMLTCLGARTASYSKNQTIFWEGEPASLIGVVLSGKVQIAKDDFFGNRNIISMMEPSQLFGEAFACAGIEKLPVTATAVTDSEILLLDCRRVITTCGNSCAFIAQELFYVLFSFAVTDFLQQKCFFIHAAFPLHVFFHILPSD